MSCENFQEIQEYTQGDEILIQGRLKYDLFDWTDTVIRCDLRKSPDAPTYIARFSITGDATTGTTTTYATTSTGLATYAFLASGDITSSWPVSRLYGAIEVSRETPKWGPYTPFKFIVPITVDPTR